MNRQVDRRRTFRKSQVRCLGGKREEERRKQKDAEKIEKSQTKGYSGNARGRDN